jgi:hypothetical protein
VSEKIVKIFEKHQFQKYGTYPIEIIDGRKGKNKDKSMIPKYVGLYFLGSGGLNDDVKSQAKYMTLEDGTKVAHDRKGLYFDINKWDGSDLFCLDNLLGIHIVTERVKQVLENEGISGYRLYNIEKYGKFELL